jgi:thioredoxin 1
MQAFNETNFHESINQPKVLVDFWAPWCGPCNMLTPLLEKLSQEYDGQVTFAKVNTEENPSLTADFKITALPTMIFFKDGVPVKKLVGLHPERNIKELLNG